MFPVYLSPIFCWYDYIDVQTEEIPILCWIARYVAAHLADQIWKKYQHHSDDSAKLRLLLTCCENVLAMSDMTNVKTWCSYSL